MKIKRFVNGKWVENSYIVSKNTSTVIIDPGGNADRVMDYVKENGLEVLAIINTHAHFDHIVAVSELAGFYQCPFYLHSGDTRLLRSANLYMTLFLGEHPVKIPQVDYWLDKISSPLHFGELTIDVIHTPGHTDGSVCFLIEDTLFTGDTLMKGGLGRIDLPGGNKQKLKTSLLEMKKLPQDLTICPGHGETSLLGEEFISNEALLNLFK